MGPAEIEALIREGVPGASVRVVDTVGDGNHFQATIVAAAFDGQPLVARHQLVYRSLQGAMTERVHALSIKAYTPEEWARRA